MELGVREKLKGVARRLRGGNTAAKNYFLPAGDGRVVVQDALGFKFVLYPFDRPQARLLLEREYDRTLYAAMKRLIRAGDVVFDVGAHVGEISVLAARLCAPQGKVHAFEPVPESSQRLAENLELNGCANVVLEALAVTQRAGTVIMNVFPAMYSAWNSLGRPVYASANGKPVAESHAIEVPATTLDEFCASRGIERIDFLKVDVEGFERAVLAGAERLLEEKRVGTICFEVSQIPLRGAGRTAQEIFEMLEAHEYRAYRFDERTGEFRGPVRDSAEVWTNYFAFEKKREPQILRLRSGQVNADKRG